MLQRALYRVALACVLFCLVALSVGWRPWLAQAEEVPSGCEVIYAATTRGGATLSGGGPGCSFRSTQRGEVVVVRVIDGDTIEVAGGQRVRYIGIDTPEPRPVLEFYAQEATRFNQQLLRGWSGAPGAGR